MVGPQETLLLFLGGDWGRKGVAQAIQALRYLDRADVKLMIVGSGNKGPFSHMARELGVERRVIFAGRRAEARWYYAASDIFLFPSHYEPFGLVVLEAMASGLPVLVSRDAGAAELMRDGHDGLLLDDSHDVGEIVARLGELLGSRELRQRLGGQVRHTALQYTWDRVARRTVDV